jgi:hypothetical protein
MAQSSQGLPISRLINVTVALTPPAVPFANFDTLLIIGSSPVIDGQQRIRSYNSLNAVGIDFTTAAPEYVAASRFFAQNPQPSQLYIGRWLQTASAGQLFCGPLTVAQQAMSLWTAITTGSFTITFDGGTAIPITALSFVGLANLNAVAGHIQTALQVAHPLVTCIWNGQQFVFTSSTTGITSSVSYLTPEGTGTDISGQLQGTAVLAQRNVPGYASEHPLDAVIALDNTIYWYSMMFATSPSITDADHEAIAGYIEGAANKHLYGITTNEPAALTATDTTSIGYVLSNADYNRTAVQYSSTNPYAIASLFGRGCTVDYSGTNTTITFMWKQEPTVTPEILGSSAADALNSNNYNYLAQFNNNTAIIVNGQVASGFYIDEIWGVDWLANQVQIDLYNLLYQTPKVPQTDPGIHLLVTTTENALTQGVTNGLLAPGVWQTQGFGALNQGDWVGKGFYVYAQSVALQPPADRHARKSPLIQVAAKLAGAVHTVDVFITVNE